MKLPKAASRARHGGPWRTYARVEIECIAVTGDDISITGQAGAG
jgi:hypothetical protein